MTPILLLSVFAYLNGGGLGKADRQTAALGLIFGGLGDFIIGMRHDGIILGALAFGIGHLFYLVRANLKIWKKFWKSLVQINSWIFSMFFENLVEFLVKSAMKKSTRLPEKKKRKTEKSDLSNFLWIVVTCGVKSANTKCTGLYENLHKKKRKFEFFCEFSGNLVSSPQSFTASDFTTICKK